jgi:hypothetical protein
MYCLSSGLRTNNFRRRVPVGPFLLAADCRTPGPDKAFPADAHAIANGLFGIVYEVEKMTGRIDDDRSRRLVRLRGLEVDHRFELDRKLDRKIARLFAP